MALIIACVIVYVAIGLLFADEFDVAAIFWPILLPVAIVLFVHGRRDRRSRDKQAARVRASGCFDPESGFWVPSWEVGTNHQRSGQQH